MIRTAGGYSAAMILSQGEYLISNGTLQSQDTFSMSNPIQLIDNFILLTHLLKGTNYKPTTLTDDYADGGKRAHAKECTIEVRTSDFNTATKAWIDNQITLQNTLTFLFFVGAYSNPNNTDSITLGNITQILNVKITTDIISAEVGKASYLKITGQVVGTVESDIINQFTLP